EVRARHLPRRRDPQGSLKQLVSHTRSRTCSGPAYPLEIEKRHNDQGHKSRRWSRIKRLYNAYPWLRPVLLSYGFVRAWGVSLLLDLYHLKPFASWREYHQVRGMSPWWDVVDWIGGWPFEVATPEAVFRFYRDRGFRLQNMITRQGYGCNEFVFKKNAT
ncbi:MAG: hypothetical protein AB1744_02570, partial [Candidatus Zixiibacteriota bacterium]